MVRCGRPDRSTATRSTCPANVSGWSRCTASRPSSGVTTCPTYKERGAMEAILGLVVLVIALFVIVTVVKSVRIVPQQRMDVVERFGKYKRTLSPGLNVLAPMIDSVRTKVDMREQVV